MQEDKIVREHLVKFLRGGNAFVTLDKALEGIPFEKAGWLPDGLPYSLWQQIEHLRISQKDILDFTKNIDYVEIKWPEDYWPKDRAPKDRDEWAESLQAIKDDFAEMIDLIEDPANDLFTPFPHGTGQTLFREAVLIAEHNAYHTGQILVIRRLLDIW